MIQQAVRGLCVGQCEQKYNREVSDSDGDKVAHRISVNPRKELYHHHRSATSRLIIVTQLVVAIVSVSKVDKCDFCFAFGSNNDNLTVTNTELSFR